LRAPSGNLPLKFSEVEPSNQPIKTVEVVVSRSEYLQAVGNEHLLATIRLVPILKNQYASSTSPEYRLFGVRDGSAYQLLGLQNADIILAANDYVIFESQNFPKFLTLLRDEKSGSITIRREGVLMLIKVRFSE
jgi:type II secretory pathway component PulC